VRIVAWNCRRARATSDAWEYFRELDPHVALLQEVTDLPDNIRRRWVVGERLRRGSWAVRSGFDVVAVAGAIEGGGKGVCDCVARLAAVLDCAWDRGPGSWWCAGAGLCAGGPTRSRPLPAGPFWLEG
jgi:hypothetical protein